MIHAQNDKETVMIAPKALSAAGTACGIVDTIGADYCVISLYYGTSGTSATDNASVLILGESDTQSTATTVLTNVTAVQTGDTDFTIPTGVTSGSQVVRFEVSCKTRKRYLNLNLTAGAATGGVAAIAHLTRNETIPTTASGKGVTTLVQV